MKAPLLTQGSESCRSQTINPKSASSEWLSWKQSSVLFHPDTISEVKSQRSGEGTAITEWVSKHLSGGQQQAESIKYEKSWFQFQLQHQFIQFIQVELSKARFMDGTVWLAVELPHHFNVSMNNIKQLCNPHSARVDLSE